LYKIYKHILMSNWILIDVILGETITLHQSLPEVSLEGATHLRQWTEEGFDADAGVVHSKVVVSKSSGHANGGH